MSSTFLGAYKNWMTAAALPVWATDGFDMKSGRFHERLSLQKKPMNLAHRSMVQARQIYVYASASELGWFADGQLLAERAMYSLKRDFLSEDAKTASFAFSIRVDGAVVSEVRDSYSHAFILFALAALYRVSGDAALLRLAAKTNAYIKTAFHDALHEGLFDAWPVTTRDKRQNPLMHLLEAYLALERAAPGLGYLEDAAGVIALFKSRLFSGQYGVVLEYFAEDWSAHSDSGKKGVFEPGHHFEWVWLLHEYEALSGEHLAEWRDRLMDVAVRSGIAANGLIFDEVGVDMLPVRESHRLWPHTEAIKAAAALNARGNSSHVNFADEMARLLLTHFLSGAFDGGWIDQSGRNGNPLVDYVPASSLYHLFFAASEGSREFLL
jgi:mannose/cellobiose epimerase-like protein (N-acyl-D-glucosamine 2-epimerase family)